MSTRILMFKKQKATLLGPHPHAKLASKFDVGLRTASNDPSVSYYDYWPSLIMQS